MPSIRVVTSSSGFANGRSSALSAPKKSEPAEEEDEPELDMTPEDVVEAKKEKDISAEMIGPQQISNWNYFVDGDLEYPIPDGLKIYRVWAGGNASKDTIKRIDFTESRGSGCSAVVDAAESNFRHIFIIGFDILGAQQWDHENGEMSRKQNNIYKNTRNYPDRTSMKAYLKYEWMYQLTQITRRFPKSNFYFINRVEYIQQNQLLPYYMNYSKENFWGASYAELQKFLDNPRDPQTFFKWIKTPIL